MDNEKQFGTSIKEMTFKEGREANLLLPVQPWTLWCDTTEQNITSRGERYQLAAKAIVKEMEKKTFTKLVNACSLKVVQIRKPFFVKTFKNHVKGLGKTFKNS